VAETVSVAPTQTRHDKNKANIPLEHVAGAELLNRLPVLSGTYEFKVVFRTTHQRNTA